MSGVDTNQEQVGRVTHDLSAEGVKHPPLPQSAVGISSIAAPITKPQETEVTRITFEQPSLPVTSPLLQMPAQGNPSSQNIGPQNTYLAPNPASTAQPTASISAEFQTASGQLQTTLIRLQQKLANMQGADISLDDILTLQREFEVMMSEHPVFGRYGPLLGSAGLANILGPLAPSALTQPNKGATLMSGRPPVPPTFPGNDVSTLASAALQRKAAFDSQTGHRQQHDAPPLIGSQPVGDYIAPPTWPSTSHQPVPSLPPQSQWAQHQHQQHHHHLQQPVQSYPSWPPPSHQWQQQPLGHLSSGPPFYNSTEMFQQLPTATVANPIIGTAAASNDAQDLSTLLSTLQQMDPESMQQTLVSLLSAGTADQNTMPVDEPRQQQQQQQQQQSDDQDTAALLQQTHNLLSQLLQIGSGNEEPPPPLPPRY